MKAQLSILKPVLGLAIMLLLAVSVIPALASDAISGDMISNTVSGAGENPSHPTHDSCYLDKTGIHCPPAPHPVIIVGACTIDEHGVKHCPYPPFLIYPDNA